MKRSECSLSVSFSLNLTVMTTGVSTRVLSIAKMAEAIKAAFGAGAGM